MPVDGVDARALIGLADAEATQRLEHMIDTAAARALRAVRGSQRQRGERPAARSGSAGNRPFSGASQPWYAHD